ncbi:MAG: nickel-dependent lactate racemase [Verrucomicrobia bacterium]|nr:nickel-dependent lactate racemase [Verrucomicrobiota bacterium]
MIVRLAYGQGHLPIDFPESRTTVIEPRAHAGLSDERAAFLRALENPIAARPLREWIRPGDRVCVSFSDITRATPNERIIPWLLDHLAFVPRENIVLLNQLGTHRPNTGPELERLLTPEVARNYRVLNHEPENLDAHRQFGVMRDGGPAWINRHCADADVRIVTGFIEPHFFAGFSGGVKGVIPGVAALRTVMSSHNARNIGDPNASFGVTFGNPLWEELRDVALRVGPSFLVNVTLNQAREITAVFAGDLIEAHRQGCEFVRESVMQPQEEAFDVVVATNSGYPLDLNLYQGVKGMSAGARILKAGGLLILACECREGVPAGSPMDQLHRSARSAEELLKRIMSGRETQPEQWQAQIQALVQRRARVLVYSSLPEEVVRACHLEPCRDIREAVMGELRRLGGEGRIGVLPQGPLTIPYLRPIRGAPASQPPGDPR